MQYLRIGRSELRASRVGLGGMALSGAYGAVSRSDAVDVITASLDAGVNFFDTADVYGAGDNEHLIGEALRAHRDRVVIATKGGATRDAQGRATNNGRPEYLTQACDASLARLGMTEVDLYYLHRADPQVPIEESVGALARLVERGKVRAIGLSEVSPETLRRACKVHPISALQTEYSLTCRFVEEELLATCEELGVSFVAYSPLGRGLIGGSLAPEAQFAPGDIRTHIPRFARSELEHNLSLIDRLRVLASELGITVAQLAIAWVLAQRGHPFAIPGTRTARRAVENAQAGEIELPRAVWEKLSDPALAGQIRGARHTEAMLARTGL